MIGKYVRLMLEAAQVDKFLQTLGEFWYLNFSKQYQELREQADQQIKIAQDKAKEQIALSFRTVFQVNQDRRLSEDRSNKVISGLESKVSELQTRLDRTEEMYGEQFDRANDLEERLRYRSANIVNPRLARVFRDMDRNRLPVIFSTPNGRIIHANFKDGQGLLGLNLHRYLIDKQFPPASGQRDYKEVKVVAMGGHVYGVLRRDTLTLSGEPNGEITRFRKIGLYEHLMHGLQKTVYALHHKREKAKPQET